MHTYNFVNQQHFVSLYLQIHIIKIISIKVDRQTNQFSAVQHASRDVSLFLQVHFVFCWAKHKRKTRHCRKLYNRNFMLCMPYQTQNYLCDRMTEDKTWHVGHMGTKRNEYKILMGNPNGTRPLWKHRQRRVYNIKTELKLTVWEIVDTTDLAQHGNMQQAIMNMVMKLWFHTMWEIFRLVALLH
jgi:hypothetical protein